MRLEKEIAAFLDDWPALRDANNALIREAITGDNNDRPTIAIAEQIARAFKVKGFSTRRRRHRRWRGSRPEAARPDAPEDLYDDPTHFEGPETLEAPIGKVKGVYFKLNAKDGFLGQVAASCTITLRPPRHRGDEITVGELRSGRVGVCLSPCPRTPTSAPTSSVPRSRVDQDLRRPRPAFEWTTKIEIVERPLPSSPDRQRRAGPRQARAR